MRFLYTYLFYVHHMRFLTIYDNLLIAISYKPPFNIAHNLYKDIYFQGDPRGYAINFFVGMYFSLGYFFPLFLVISLIFYYFLISKLVFIAKKFNLKILINPILIFSIVNMVLLTRNGVEGFRPLILHGMLFMPLCLAAYIIIFREKR